MQKIDSWCVANQPQLLAVFPERAVQSHLQQGEKMVDRRSIKKCYKSMER